MTQAWDRLVAWKAECSKRMSTCDWWHRSYAIDWVVSIVVFLIVMGTTYFLKPVNRFLPPNDPTVMYPQEPDIVSNGVLFVISLALPWVVIGFMQIRRRSAHDFHHASLTLIACILLTNTVTTAMKYGAGRYRPNWDAVQDVDARLSFPSGHSSTAFTGMTFLTLYLLGKFKIYSVDGASNFYKAIVLSSPMAIAIFVALSRTIDYHHNYSDVIAGAMVGIGVSYFVYYMYYPPLYSKACDEPKLHPSLLPAVNISLSEVKVDSNLSYSGKTQMEANQTVST